MTQKASLGISWAEHIGTKNILNRRNRINNKFKE